MARALGVDPGWLLDLSQTLNPFAPDVGALAGWHLDVLRSYPDATVATRLLGGALDVDPDRLVLTNGGSEAIALVAAEIGGQVRAEPDFGLYPRGADGPVWRSDPHSPSGRLAAPGDHADVWDEAFLPMAAGRWTAHRPGVAVGSLTKAFACPGLRLGYVISDDAEALRQRQPRWSVGSLALAVLPELLELADPPGWTAAIATARARLCDELVGRGLEIDVHDAPWVLVRSPGLRERLIPHGVLVRDCASFDMRGVARVAVPDDAGCERLLRALDRAFYDGVPTGPARAEPPADRSDVASVRAVVFDIGDTLVRAARPGTPVGELVAEPIGDALSALRELSGHVRLGALTDTSVMRSADVRRALRGSGLDECLEVIVTSVDAGAPKPDPAGLRQVMDRLGVEPSATLVVGDADVDRDVAAAVGARFARAGGDWRLADVVARAAVTPAPGN